MTARTQVLVVTVLAALWTVSAAAQAPAVAAAGEASQATQDSRTTEGVVQGRVLLPGNQPAADVPVTVVVVSYGGAGIGVRKGAEAVTQADGTFRTTVTWSGTHQMRGLFVVAQKRPYALAWETFQTVTDAGSLKPVSLTLQEASEATGSVKSAVGEPVVNAKVAAPLLFAEGGVQPKFLMSREGMEFLVTRTDARGRFTLGGIPKAAQFVLKVTAEGHGERWVPGIQFQPNVGMLSVASGPQDIQLEPEATVSGTLRRGDGGPPVPGAGVTIVGGTQMMGMAEVKTDERGEFTFRGLSSQGPYQVRMAAPVEGAREQAKPVLIQLSSGEKRTAVDLVARPMSGLHLRVVTGDNEGVANANVQLSSSELRSGQVAVTDATGLAKLDLLPGTWRVGGVNVNGGWHSVTATLVVEPGKVLKHDVVIAAFESRAGLVRDEAGAPVAGASVHALPDPRGVPLVTDAEGRFVYSWSPTGGSRAPVMFVVQHTERNLAAAVAVPAEKREVPITLKPGVTVRGTVVDAEGLALADAFTTARIEIDGQRGASAGRSVTGEDGRYELTALPPGAKISVQVNLKGYGPAMCEAGPISLQGSPKELPPLTVRAAALQIAGVVVDSRGDALEGVRLRASGSGQPNRTALSDAQGRFTFDKLCPGTVSIHAWTQGGIHRSQNVTAAAGDAGVEVVFPALPKIAGVATDEAGNPVVGAQAQVLPFGERLGGATDAEGRFTVSWNSQHTMEGRPLALVVRHAERRLAGSITIQPSQKTAEVTLLPTMDVRGRTVDHEGDPIGGVRVSVMFKGEWWSSSVSDLAATTAADGTFVLKAVPVNAKVSFKTYREGYGEVSVDREPGEAPEGDVALPDFTLSKADVEVTGVVVDAQGEPVLGARIQTSGSGQSHQNVQTDANGAFTLKGLCAGQARVQVYFQAEGAYTNKTHEFSTDEDVRIVLEDLRSTRGRVLAPDGSPVPGVSVVMVPSQTQQEDNRTDEEGAFRVRWSTRQFGRNTPDLYLLARQEAQNLAAVQQVAPEQGLVEITIQPAAILSGQVHDEQGNGIAGARVRASIRLARRTAAIGRRSATTDADGAYTIAALPRGASLIVQASADARGRDRQDTQTPAQDADFVETELAPFVLRRADLTVAGVVLDDDDQPVAGVHVNFSGDGQPSESARTDAEGKFLIAHACPGPGRLSASSSGRVYRRGQADVEGGDQEVRLILSTPVGHYITYSRLDIPPRPELGRDFDPEKAFYWCDFEGDDARDEWSRTDRHTVVVEGEERRILGQFSTGALSLGIGDLPEHKYVRLYFELYCLASWDGNRTDWGPDILQARIADGPRLLCATFSNQSYAQSYPMPFRLGVTGGQTGAVSFTQQVALPHRSWDAHTIYPMCFVVPHSERDFGLCFAGTNLSGIEDEGWGIDNVGIQLLQERPAPIETTEKALEAAWAELGDRETATAWKAMDTLQKAGDPGVEFIIGKLGWSYDAELAGYVREVGAIFEHDDEFAWQEALEECRRMPARAQPFLQWCIDARRYGSEPPPFIDAVLKLEKLPEERSRDRLRQGRAIWILERAWSPSARRALLIDEP